MEVYRGKNITIDRINLFSSFKIIINNVLCIVSVSLSYKYMVAILVKFSIVRRSIAKHSAITHNTSCKNYTTLYVPHVRYFCIHTIDISL